MIWTVDGYTLGGLKPSGAASPAATPQVQVYNSKTTLIMPNDTRYNPIYI
jgi:hypothetical protein